MECISGLEGQGCSGVGLEEWGVLSKHGTHETLGQFPPERFSTGSTEEELLPLVLGFFLL